MFCRGDPEGENICLIISPSNVTGIRAVDMHKIMYWEIPLKLVFSDKPQLYFILNSPWPVSSCCTAYLK